MIILFSLKSSKMLVILCLVSLAVYVKPAPKQSYKWSDWESWSDCNRNTLKSTLAVRRRYCLDEREIRVDDKKCARADSECRNHQIDWEHCSKKGQNPMEPMWSEWEEWTGCSKDVCVPARRVRKCMDQNGLIQESWRCGGGDTIETDVFHCDICKGISRQEFYQDQRKKKLSDKRRKEMTGSKYPVKDRGALSWVVTLSYIRENKRQHFCSGIILSSTWIMTAGHCICEANSDNVKGKDKDKCCQDGGSCNSIDTSDWKITAGVTDLKNIDKEGQTRSVSTIVVHEDYNNRLDVIEMDVALIKLDQAFDFDIVTVQPCLLPARRCVTGYSRESCVLHSTWGRNQECKASGWNIYKSIAQRVSLWVEKSRDNDTITVSRTPGNSPDRVCEGFSGGPLSCTKDESGQYRDDKVLEIPPQSDVVIGINSLITLSGCMKHDLPDVLHFSLFINQTISWIADKIISWGEWGACSLTKDGMGKTRIRSGYFLEFGYFPNDGPLYQSYTGVDIEEDYDNCEDPCFAEPCKNSGTCQAQGIRYECICATGYSGKTCESRDICQTNPCKNGGKCTAFRNGFKCACPSGYSGTTCNIRDRCKPNPCKNGGKCKASKKWFKCICESGYRGNTCETRDGYNSPNIVLIITDSLGYNDIGFRNPKFVTPVIDNLSKEGIRLDNYYVDTLSTAFRASLMTGKYHAKTGAMAEIPLSTDHCIPKFGLNLPERLQRAGYSTYFIGKWHMGYSRPSCLPRNRGFDYFYGSYVGWKGHTTHKRKECVRRGNATTIGKPCCLRKIASFGDCVYKCWSNYIGIDLVENETPVVDADGEFGNDLLTRKAIEKIGKHSNKKKMFLTVAYINQFVNPPREYLDKITKIPEGRLGVNESPRRGVAAMVNSVDTGIGRIIQKLRDTGLWENTVLVVTSDKGGNENSNNNWPLRGSKFNYFEGGIRGLGIVAGPITFKAKTYNESNSQLYHVSDWYKTFLNLARAPIGGSGEDSHDIWSSICTYIDSPRKEILHSLNVEMPKLGKPLYKNTFDSSIQAVLRMDNFKLFTGRTKVGGFTGWTAPAEYPNLVTIEPNPDDVSNIHLYNIKDDPTEKKDLSAANPSQVKVMLDRLKELQNGTIREPHPCPDPKGKPKPVKINARESVDAWLPWL
ncbi:unnamed protein product [Owenia fusiformis]|uniref:Uncharacterized protein n=1 Tax=Owenia fusiformis TaxID=6347 RepID=A0A8S4PGC2_OWEFU|nr:unnamed protein product [Owenia fusiformis]